MPKIPPGVQVKDLSQTPPSTAAQGARQGWADRIGLFGQRVGMALDVLGGRDFGPGTPLAPRTDPQSVEQTQGPRQWQYPVAANTFPAPRREMPGLTPFEQLRNLAELYDVAAMAIAVRIEELQGIPFSIVAKNKKRQAQVQDLCDEVAAFFDKPDGVNDFDAWFGMLAYDLFTIDAATVYLRPDLAGRLCAVEVVDGSTIKPLLDDRGRTAAYQQVLYGYPFSEYKRPDAPEDFPTFGTQQMWYKPRWTRARTPYGFPPTEWIILRVNTALRKQTFDLAHFTDGNIPRMLISPPEGLMNPDQVAQFEEWFNATLQGEDRARNRAMFIAWAATIKELTPFEYKTDLDYWMLRVTCAAYGTPPHELGFTDDVNKSTSEMQEALNERRGLRPLTMWLKRGWWDPIIQKLGEPANAAQQPAISYPHTPTRRVVSAFSEIEASYAIGEQDETLAQAQEDEIYWNMGVAHESEFRSLRFGDVLEGDAPGPPTARGIQSEVQSPQSEVWGKLEKKGKAPEPDWEERLRRERVAQKLFRQAYDAQAQRIKAKIRDTAEDQIIARLKEIFADEPAQMKQAVLPFFDETARAAAEEGLGHLTIGVNWDQVNKAVLELAQARAQAFADKASETSQEQTQVVIADWIENRTTKAELIERVSNVWAGPRPDVAAVTEVTDLYSQGNIAAWKESGRVTGYKFKTTKSDVCDDCLAAEAGGPYDLDDEEHRPPLHPRCRCWTTPVVRKPGAL